MPEIAELLEKWSQGDANAFEELVPVVYAELKQLAQRQLRNEQHAPTLNRTALVHEAYLRLADQNRIQWNGRAHFFGAAAQVMRRVLVEHARKRLADKRGAGAVSVPFDELMAVSLEPDLDALELNAALDELAVVDAGSARVVELRCFGGFSIEETAEAMGVSASTVTRHWTYARAWLYRRLKSPATQE